MGKKQITALDIGRARQLVRQYGEANLSSLPRAELIKLVKIHYETLQRRPLEDSSNDQLYRVAQRLYNQDREIVRRANEGTLVTRF